MAGLLAGLALLATAPVAHANGVQWSIGIQLPPVGAVVTSVPPVPAYPVYGPPPVVYAPATVYVPPPRVVYAPPPPPVVYVPPRVVYAPPAAVYTPPPPAWGWAPPPRHHHGWRDRDRDGIPDRWDHWDDRRGRGW